ncbi:group I intron-associated PD-(D/E)XK endonuclease [Arsukibacterium perlucidum]|uniref:group I intron-associated PD-(D/E)XK endonuclease n=1 Tax=Arsukibacterium perlucidum TaxID=368811 RepID=UPI000475F129|nr:group I intron-associated PD-(D/E)XK endonuclease [Arsukibacterium perlucidum]
MPLKTSLLPSEHQRQYQNHSFENLAASMFMADGWEVFQPFLDHGRKTDLLISDGQIFYRIQIKSLNTTDESFVVKNLWSNTDTQIDYVVYFSQKGNWGYIIKPFCCEQKRLNAAGGQRFHKHLKHFSQAFAKI